MTSSAPTALHVTSQHRDALDSACHTSEDCALASQVEEDAVPPAQRLPLYSQRQSPLVQAHGASAFVERTWSRFGIQDMAHEWVTVFQSMVHSEADQPQHLPHKDGTMHSNRRNKANGSSGMRLQIPDTILFNPSGQPSLWFATASSGRVKAKHSTHTTTREILQELTTSPSSPRKSSTDIVAVQRIGFQTRMLTTADLKALCTEMESTRSVLLLPKLAKPSEACPQSNMNCETDDSRTLRPPIRSYCLQKFVPRYGGVRFFAVWRPRPKLEEPMQPVDRSSRRNAVPNLQGGRSYPQSVQDPRHISSTSAKRPNDTSERKERNASFVCDLFLQRYYPVDGHSASRTVVKRDDFGDEDFTSSGGGDEDDATNVHAAKPVWDGWMDQVERAEDLLPLYLKRKPVKRRNGANGQCDDQNDEEHDELAQIKRVLHNMALDPDVVIPQLFQAKRVTGELLTRINRTGGCNGSARHCVGLACEFLLDERNRQCYLSGIAGIQWDNCEPSWDLLRFQDATAAKLSATISACDRKSNERGTENDDAVSPKKRIMQLHSLRLFEELNPRFPSVQSPITDAVQWKLRSALIPPDAAPRFIGAEVPKKFRRGRFHPLLRPEQAVSVSRLHLSPRAPSPLASAVRHPLSRRFANEEDEIGARPQAGGSPRQRLFTSDDTMSAI